MTGCATPTWLKCADIFGAGFSIRIGRVCFVCVCVCTSAQQSGSHVLIPPGAGTRSQQWESIHAQNVPTPISSRHATSSRKPSSFIYRLARERVRLESRLPAPVCWQHVVARLMCAHLRAALERVYQMLQSTRSHTPTVFALKSYFYNRENSRAPLTYKLCMCMDGTRTCTYIHNAWTRICCEGCLRRVVDFNFCASRAARFEGICISFGRHSRPLHASLVPPPGPSSSILVMCMKVWRGASKEEPGGCDVIQITQHQWLPTRRRRRRRPLAPFGVVGVCVCVCLQRWHLLYNMYIICNFMFMGPWWNVACGMKQ